MLTPTKHKDIFMLWQWPDLGKERVGIACLGPYQSILKILEITADKRRRERLIRCEYHRRAGFANSSVLFPQRRERNDRVPFARGRSIRKVAKNHIHGAIRNLFHFLKAISHEESLRDWRGGINSGPSLWLGCWVDSLFGNFSIHGCVSLIGAPRPMMIARPGNRQR